MPTQVKPTKASTVGGRPAFDVKDDMLTCKVCLGHYNSSTQRPRSLHCQHTFCERCIHDCLFKRNKVQCPLCGIKTRFTDAADGVHHLPVNATAMGVRKQQRQAQHWAGSYAEDGTLHELHKVVVKKNVRLHPPPSERDGSSTILTPQPDSDDENLVTLTGPQQSSQADEPRSKGKITFLLPTADNAGFDMEDEIDEHSDITSLPDEAVVPRGASDTSTVPEPTAHYVGRLGKYYNASPETGGPAFKPGEFLHPSSVACFPASRQSGNGRVVVVDPATSTVQLFTSNGDCLSIFHQVGARSACFVFPLDGNDPVESCRVAVATDSGVSMFDQLGRLEKTIPLVDVVGLASYQHGFVAAQRNRLSLCNRVIPTATMSTVSSFIDQKSQTSTNGQFRGIVDLAVSSTVLFGTLLYVLDVDAVYLIDPASTVLRGLVQLGPVDPTVGITTRPHPVSVDVDPTSGYVIVSDADTQRVSMYDGGDDGRGRLVRCLVQLGASMSGMETCGHVAVGNGGLLFVVVSGSGIAEVRMFNI